MSGELKILLSVYGTWQENDVIYAKVSEPIRGGWRYLGKIIIGRIRKASHH